jgi:hypothetical protein
VAAAGPLTTLLLLLEAAVEHSSLVLAEVEVVAQPQEVEEVVGLEHHIPFVGHS